MAIIVGDIHGNVEKVKRFLGYRSSQQHVALGDYVDSFTESIDSQVETLRLLTESDAVLLWGNHDLQYLSDAPWKCSGYQPEHQRRLGKICDELLHARRLRAAHWVDGWLCTHAGFVEGGSGLTPEGCCRGNTHHLADCINRHFYASLAHNHASPLFNVPVARGGKAPYGGIFWLDPFHENLPLDGTYRQIFGHTERKQPVVTERWICLDTTNSDDIWVFDTETEELVNLMSPEELRHRHAQRHREAMARHSAFSGGF